MADMKLLNFKSVFLVLSAFGVCIVSSQMVTNKYINMTKQEEILYLRSMNNFTLTPSMMFGIKNVQVSPQCRTALQAYMHGLTSFEDWAISMFDATSKVQSGFLAGNFYNLGAYDECQSIKNVPVNMTINGEKSIGLINGNYCLGKTGKPGDNTAIVLYWAMCAPDACNADDLNAITSALKVPLTFNEKQCHSPAQDPKIDDGDIAVIVCFSVIGVIMLLSSLFDCYLRQYEKKAAHPIFLAFSVISNGEKLITTRKSADQMECISGIRFISMMWVILGHSFSNMAMMPVTDVGQVLNFYGDQGTMIIRGATVAVDSFFLMSGILMVYVYLRTSKDKQFFNIALFYLHRYLRLTPALAAVLVVHLTVLKHFGGGPYWNLMDDFCIHNCHKYWWTVLLYIQNFVSVGELCIGQSWYLSCDMQLFFISPIFLLPLKRWPRATLVLALAATLASMFAGFGIVWEYKLVDTSAIYLQILQDPKHSTYYMNKYYIQTYTRAAPYFIGIIVGYYVYQAKLANKKFTINIILNLLLWACSIAVLATCVFYDTAKLTEYNQLQMSSYIAFYRSAWAIALAWVIFACVTGHGGPVNTFLSAPIFQILARFTYSMYLTHFTIILVIYFSTKQPIAFSTARVLFDYWSMLCLVFAISVVWTMAFESPVLIIEKIIFGGIGNSANKQDVAPRDASNSEQIATIITMENGQEEKARNNLHHRGGNGVTNNGYVDNEHTDKLNSRSLA